MRYIYRITTSDPRTNYFSQRDINIIADGLTHAEEEAQKMSQYLLEGMRRIGREANEATKLSIEYDPKVSFELIKIKREC